MSQDTGGSPTGGSTGARQAQQPNGRPTRLGSTRSPPRGCAPGSRRYLVWSARGRRHLRLQRHRNDLTLSSAGRRRRHRRPSGRSATVAASARAGRIRPARPTASSSSARHSTLDSSPSRQARAVSHGSTRPNRPAIRAMTWSNIARRRAGSTPWPAATARSSGVHTTPMSTRWPTRPHPRPCADVVTNESSRSCWWHGIVTGCASHVHVTAGAAHRTSARSPTWPRHWTPGDGIRGSRQHQDQRPGRPRHS